MAHGLSCCVASGIFPDQGSTLSPELAGRLLITEPPGKPDFFFFSGRQGGEEEKGGVSEQNLQ